MTAKDIAAALYGSSKGEMPLRIQKAQQHARNAGIPWSEIEALKESYASKITSAATIDGRSGARSQLSPGAQAPGLDDPPAAA